MTYLAQIDFNTLRGAFPGGSMLADPNLTLGSIVSRFLPYVFVFAGLGVLVYLILGGLQLMTSGGDPKAVEEGKKKITNALIGFLVIFVSFWLAQALEIIFGIGPGIF